MKPMELLEEYSPESLYGYIPGLSPNICMVVFFSLVSIAHIVQWLMYRQWWLVILPIGTLAELSGYALRIHDHFNPHLRDYYVAMMCLLIITPCLFAAVHFTCAGRLGTMFPRELSIVRPVFIMPFFVTLDVVSLVIQAIGAATAGTADSGPLVGYVTFNICFLSFWYRARTRRPELIRKYEPFMYAIFFSSVAIILRSIYRVIEMGFGWDGVINNTEWALCTFDGALVLISVFILNLYYPGRYLPRNFSWKSAPEDFDVLGGTMKERHDVESSSTAEAPKELDQEPGGEEHQPPLSGEPALGHTSEQGA
ncbi:hypothetical protein MSPP1_001303 [Malassezia sp. CBS 17886]|nr:hypothetical protein MSPP1_001303 [Malassezia sp. CBS 17886]